MKLLYIILFFICLVTAIVDTIWSPRLDLTCEGEMLLWYNHKGHRIYKRLFKLP